MRGGPHRRAVQQQGLQLRVGLSPGQQALPGRGQHEVRRQHDRVCSHALSGCAGGRTCPPFHRAGGNRGAALARDSAARRGWRGRRARRSAAGACPVDRAPATGDASVFDAAPDSAHARLAPCARARGWLGALVVVAPHRPPRLSSRSRRRSRTARRVCASRRRAARRSSVADDAGAIDTFPRGGAREVELGAVAGAVRASGATFTATSERARLRGASTRARAWRRRVGIKVHDCRPRGARMARGVASARRAQH